MTKLAFIVPTWNRPQQLERCVESIAGQVRGDDVTIVIQDDASEEATAEICRRLAAKYHFVRYVVRVLHTDYSDAFRDMFRLARDYEWVWTFGDDDLLQPKALDFVLERLAVMEAGESKPDFIHFAEAKRASGTNGVYYAHTLLQLCETLGWIEMTGFITGNLCRGPLLAQAAETPLWRTYAKSSFVHSCALLEALHNRPAAFYDVPVVTSQEMEQSNDTLKRWAASNIGLRYLYVVDAIEAMFDAEILKDKLPNRFFRYLNLNLWDRYLIFFVNDYLDGKGLWADDAWHRVVRFGQFLKDEDYAKELMQRVEAARGLTTLAYYMGQNRDILHLQLRDIGGKAAESVYPHTFCEARP